MHVSWLLRNSVVYMILLVTDVYAHFCWQIVRPSRLHSIHSAPKQRAIRTLPYLYDRHTQRRKRWCLHLGVRRDLMKQHVNPPYLWPG